MAVMSVSTVNISFPKSLLKALDAAAVAEHRSRSDLLREATRLYIERKRRLSRMFSFWRAVAKARRLTPGGVEAAIRKARKAK